LTGDREQLHEHETATWRMREGWDKVRRITTGCGANQRVKSQRERTWQALCGDHDGHMRRGALLRAAGRDLRLAGDSIPHAQRASRTGVDEPLDRSARQPQ